ncbi:MAG: hypothetical protein EU539_02890 [Promethearchaeota archaeon]|nr:MAG: hypothetical protein EU539_02890 [Candidatus Lokiarchaeota archaeon]
MIMVGIPEYILKEAEGLIKHEKTFDSNLGKERITVFVPEIFSVNDTYWNQFIPDHNIEAGSISKKEREYKFVGREIVHINYDLEPKVDERPDIRKLSACPHPNCVYCLQINKIKTQFENGVYRLLKPGDHFSFYANANLIQATMWVDHGKGQIIAYEGNKEFMKSEIINKHQLACVSSYGRRLLRKIKFIAKADGDDTNHARLWCHIGRYNIENWP